MKTTVKTLEFKLSLNPEQSAIIDHWMKAQQHVWNSALSLLIQHETFSSYCKIDKAYHPCCPVPWEYRYIPDPEKNGYICVPYSRIGTVINHQYRQSCPIPQAYQQPQIKSAHKFSLTPWFAYKTLSEQSLPGGFPLDVELISSAPAKVMQGTIELLHTSWQEYKKRTERGMPRFKTKRFSITTIRNTDHLNIKDGDRVLLPKIKQQVKVKGLSERLKNVSKVCQGFTISKKASGYYLYLAVEVPFVAFKDGTSDAGFDAGIVHLLTDDKGKHYANPRYLKTAEKRLKRLQRQASRKYLMNSGKTNKWKKLQSKINRLHEKVSRQRKSYAHKTSTFIVSKHQNIFVEDLNLQGMRKRAKVKPNEEGTGFLPNGQSAKSGLNKAIADAGMGQVISLIETKANHHGRTFKKVPAHHTSQTCAVCGAVDKNNRLSQSLFTCLSCGHSDNADTNAAKNIKQRGYDMLK